MKPVFIRTVSFAALTACAYILLWTPFRASHRAPMRLEDFVVCAAIQTCVPLSAWIMLHLCRISRGMQVVVTLFWTWIASSSLVLLAEKFHDSGVYQPPRPWDYLLYEGGIIAYLAVMTMIFALIAAALTLLPVRRKAANDPLHD